MKPIFPISNMATFLFRKGTGGAEKDFAPDGELMQEMMTRKIRVQDLLDAIIGGVNSDAVEHVKSWWMKNKKQGG
jgi:hypothetical protein